MFQKDMRRGERRWRSHCVWMRRLKEDWAMHGRQYNIRPVYDSKGSEHRTIVGWSNDLCRCFDLKNREAYRFKDTPHGRCSRYECNPRKVTHGLESRPIQEWRDEEVERENWHSRRRREGVRIVKVGCLRCGILLRKERVAFGKYSSKWDGHKECLACRKALEEKMRYWRNGVPVEFDKKPA